MHALKVANVRALPSAIHALRPFERRLTPTLRSRRDIRASMAGPLILTMVWVLLIKYDLMSWFIFKMICGATQWFVQTCCKRRKIIIKVNISHTIMILKLNVGSIKYTFDIFRVFFSKSIICKIYREWRIYLLVHFHPAGMSWAGLSCTNGGNEMNNL